MDAMQSPRSNPGSGGARRQTQLGDLIEPEDAVLADSQHRQRLIQPTLAEKRPYMTRFSPHIDLEAGAEWKSPPGHRILVS